jgi:hypothetical protein
MDRNMERKNEDGRNGRSPRPVTQAGVEEWRQLTLANTY